MCETLLCRLRYACLKPVQLFFFLLQIRWMILCVMFRFQECWSSPACIEKFMINLSKAQGQDRGKCGNQTGLKAMCEILLLLIC